MRILTWLFIGLFYTLKLDAQVDHFIYLQSDDLHPFYVKMNNKIMSSSSAGYIIIPKLKSGELNLVIGSPKNEYSEQKFSVQVDNKDKGYAFKKFGDKGWALYNLEDFSTIYAKNDPVVQTTPVSNNNVTDDTKPDAFTDMLASVSQDSTVKKISVYRPEPPKVEMKTDSSALTKTDNKVQPVINDVVKNPATSDTANAITTSTVKKTDVSPPVAVNNEPAVSNEVYTKSLVSLISDKNLDNNREFVFVDQQKDGTTDTVTIVIDKPAKLAKAVTQANSMDSVNFDNRTVKDDTVKIKAEAPVVSAPVKEKKEPANFQNDTPVKDSSSAVVENKSIEEQEKIAHPETKDSMVSKSTELTEKPEVTAAEKPAMPNINCQELANEDDFIELRRTMIQENNDDDMIYVARKVFKTKCFKADQIKNLAYLFLTDQGKYKFLDAAFPYVYDTGEFKKLGTRLLKDEYFLNRFNAMIGQ